MTDLVLYTNPNSRGRIARWMLEETGAPYRAEILDYDTTIKAPAYLAINPMGKVPAIRHGEAVVTECGAICAYLADAFPEAGLGAEGPERGLYFRWLFFAAGVIDPAFTDKGRGLAPTAEQEGMVGYGSLARTLDAVEGLFADGRPFVLGERFTAADVYLASQLAWGLMFGLIEERPAFRAYVERATARPAAIRAREADDALMPAQPAAPA